MGGPGEKDCRMMAEQKKKPLLEPTIVIAYPVASNESTDKKVFFPKVGCGYVATLGCLFFCLISLLCTYNFDLYTLSILQPYFVFYNHTAMAINANITGVNATTLFPYEFVPSETPLIFYCDNLFLFVLTIF